MKINHLLLSGVTIVLGTLLITHAFSLSVPVNAQQNSQSKSSNHKLLCKLSTLQNPSQWANAEVDVFNCDKDSGYCFATQLKYNGQSYNTGEFMCVPDLTSCQFLDAPTQTPLNLTAKNISCTQQ